MKRNLILAGMVLLIFAVSIYLSHRQRILQQWRVEIRARHILIMTDRNDPVKDAQALERIKEIHERILAGEDFAELARVYSEDILSAAMGGDLGFIEEGDFDERFGKAVSHLKRGEVSDVITSSYGYHLIQLIDRREPIGKP